MRFSRPLAYLATVFIAGNSGVQAISLDLSSDGEKYGKLLNYSNH